jgi:hypothetical protein
MGQLQPIPAHRAIDPDDVLTAVKDALEALQKAFRTRDETPKPEPAENANPEQPSQTPSHSNLTS